MSEKSFEEQVQTILAESSDEITRQLKERLKENVIESLSWDLKAQINAQVNTFMQGEIKDEINALLVEMQPEILTQLRNTIAAVVAHAGKRLIEESADNLKTSWDVRKLSEALFK